MKTLIIVLISLTTTFITAQNTVTWIGGTPGKETNWSESKNWSNHRVPDEFSFVIIKYNNSGHNAQPEIKGVVEVASVEIQSGACLAIKEGGEIMIDGSDFFTEGISNYGGNLINEGVINLKNMDGVTADNFQGKVKGNGMVLLNGLPINAKYFANK